MNVCFLLGGFQSNGGIGRVTSILANTLCEKENVSVHTISYARTNKPLLYNLSQKVHQHALFPSSISMVKAILFKGAISKVRKTIQEENIDVLVAAGALFYPLAILAAYGTKAKCYCWEHTNPSTTSDHKFQGWCRRYAVSYADKMIVLTQSAAEYYQNTLHISPDKLVQIYNPMIADNSTDVPYDATSKRIIAVGRLSYPKNFDRLICLSETFLANHPDWSLDIYGKGECYQDLQAQIEEANLVGRVNLMGQVDDLYSRYASYSFLVMSSRYEGFPMSLLEGATHRLPLVSFDIPTGPNEIIVDGENGFLINAKDDQRMIACINRLIEDENLRKSMSEKAYQMVQKFSLNDILDQWCEIL